MNVADKLAEYIKEQFEIGDDPDFTYDAHLFDLGFVDSLGATEMVMYVEETFKIQITQRDITLYPMNTVNEIAAVVEKKLEEGR